MLFACKLGFDNKGGVMKIRDVELNLFHKVKIRMFFEMCFVICFMLLFAGVGVASTTTVYVATDGTGDYNCDGVDDHVEINQAIANVTAGDIVHIKSGNYSLNYGTAAGSGSHDVCINIKSKIILEGDGSTTLLKLIDNYTHSMYVALIGTSEVKISSVTVRNLKIDGNFAGNPQFNKFDGSIGLRFPGPTNVIIENITIRDCSWDGIWFATYRGYDNIIRNNDVRACGHDGIRPDFQTNLILEGNYADADGSAEGTGNLAIRLTNLESSIVRNNFVLGGGGGGIAIVSSYGDSYDNIVENNTVTAKYLAYYDAAVKIYAQSGYYLNNIVFKNNILYDIPYAGLVESGAIRITGDGMVSNIYIINNTIDDVRKDGIIIESGDQIHIRNNIINNCKEYGISKTGGGSNIFLSYNNIANSGTGNYNGISAGTGDISADPLFASVSRNYLVLDKNNDFHLRSQYGRWNGSAWVNDSVTSPCIDAGDPDSDCSNEPPPNGGRINMGAYGNTGEASKSMGSTSDTVSPTVSIIAPQDGAKVFGKVPIKINATDNYEVTKVELYINDVLTHTFYSTPYEWIWNTKEIPEGEYKIKAVAYDTNDNNGEKEITVKVIKMEGMVTYPNPYVKGKNQSEGISFANLPKEATIRIYTVSGELVKVIKHKDIADGGSKDWNILGIASGVYMYCIESSEGMKKGKISIVK